MGRRALHNEGAELLISRLEKYISTDQPTSRRMFTLICVMIAQIKAGIMEKQVKQVLFSCTLNAIRSVMAEAIFNKIAPENWKSVSCGVIAGPPDGFTFAVMEEKGIYLT